jgi:hypothetical protein
MLTFGNICQDTRRKGGRADAREQTAPPSRPRELIPVFGEWTSPVEDGRMTTKPPYPHLVVGKRSESVTTAGGSIAYTHLLLELWSFIPTVIIMTLLLGTAAWSLSTGALGFHAGRVAVAAFVVLALVPVVLSLSELSPWLPAKAKAR